MNIYTDEYIHACIYAYIHKYALTNTALKNAPNFTYIFSKKKNQDA